MNGQSPFYIWAIIGPGDNHDRDQDTTSERARTIRPDSQGERMVLRQTRQGRRPALGRTRGMEMLAAFRPDTPMEDGTTTRIDGRRSVDDRMMARRGLAAGSSPGAAPVYARPPRGRGPPRLEDSACRPRPPRPPPPPIPPPRGSEPNRGSAAVVGVLLLPCFWLVLTEKTVACGKDGLHLIVVLISNQTPNPSTRARLEREMPPETRHRSAGDFVETPIPCLVWSM